jgi:hypothetical protein
MKKVFLIAAMMVASVGALAGHEVGNGGGVILCDDRAASKPQPPQPPQPPKVTVELLDLYEARVLRNLKLGLGDPKEDFSLKVDRVLTQFMRVAPLRAKKYRELYENFFNEAVIIPDADLVFIPDAGNLLLPKGCTLRQVAIQQVPEFPGDNRYFISKEYWDLMDNNSKAALVLHEIIYNEGITLGHTDSRAVRYLNSYLTSEKLAHLTQKQMTQMLFSAKFKVADLHGSLVTVNAMSAGEVTSFSFVEKLDGYYKPTFFMGFDFPKTVLYKGFVLIGDFKVYEDGNLTHLEGVGEVDLPTLKIVRTEGERGFNLTVQNGVISGFSSMAYHSQEKFGFEVRTVNLEISMSSVGMGSDQRAMAGFNFNNGFYGVHSLIGVVRSKNVVTGYESPLLILISHESNILSNGVIKNGYLAEDSVLNTPQGRLQFSGFSKSQVMYEFDETGLVRAGQLKAGQTVKTPSGDVATTEEMYVRFLSNGLAELFPAKP